MTGRGLLRSIRLLATGLALVAGSASAATLEGLPLATIDQAAIVELSLADAHSFALGISAPLSERWQLRADVTATQFRGTPAFGGLPTDPGHGAEYSYVRLTGSSLLLEGDAVIAGLDFSEGEAGRTATSLLDRRPPVGERWQTRPRLVLSLRRMDNGSVELWLTRPALRLFYRVAGLWQLELDVGGEWSRGGPRAEGPRRPGWNLYAGYRAEF